MPRQSMTHEERLAHVAGRKTSDASRSANHSRALIYAHAGIGIFPCGIDKRPLVKDWFNAASADENQINEWWTKNPEALIALAMKHVNCVTVDCDRHNPDEDGVALFAGMIASNGALPAHPTIETPNNGEHHIFRQPEGEKIGNKIIAPGLETRGYKTENDGGYIIAPGTVLPDGRGWKLAPGSPSLLKSLKADAIAQASPWLIDKLRGEPKAGWKPNGGTYHQSGRREAAYAAAALDNAANEVASATKGNRNNSLNTAALKMAGMVARGWIERTAVADALYNACIANGLVAADGAASVQKTLASGFKAGLANPHADLEDRQREKGGGKQDTKSTLKPKLNLHDWNDPDTSLLDDRRGELPEFPLDIFQKKQLRDWIERCAHGAGVTPAHVALPLLGIASALIGGARLAKPSTSWSQPATSWVAIVGFSGTGKTPGIDVTKRALAHIERVRKDKMAELQAKHETKAESAKAARAKWKEAVEAAVEAGQQPPLRPVEAIDPGPFIAPRRYVSDSTIERLAVLLQARPVGVLFLADELAGLFLNMGRYSNGSDREFWLESWNGNPYIQERMGRPPVSLDNLLIGIVGGLQPDKLAKSFEGDADGMYARVLFAWPPEPAYRPLSNEVSEVEPEIINALSRIIDLPAQDGDGELVPRKVPLSAEAMATFEQFRQFLHSKKAGLEGREREWVAKGASHVVRLSCTLAYLHWAMDGGPELTQIDSIHVEAAIRLWKGYLYAHARAALRLIGLSERHANARRVLRWLKANANAEISVKHIRRDALAQTLDAKQTEELLTGLENAGWLKHHSPERTGGRPAHRWSVNPILYSDAESAQSAERSVTDASGGLSALPALSAPP